MARGSSPYFPPIHSGLSAYFPPIGRTEVGKYLQTTSAHVRRWPALAGRISSAGRTCPANRTSGQKWAILGSNHAGGFRLGDVPHACWTWVISGSLRFAQNGTLNGTSGPCCNLRVQRGSGPTPEAAIEVARKGPVAGLALPALCWNYAEA